MKTLWLFSKLAVIVYITSLGAAAQAIEDTYGEKAVNDALLTSGVSVSQIEKEVNRLGDRAAIGIMRVLEPKKLQNPEQIKNVLAILQQAFTAPRLITRAEDRSPKATLFLLDCLQHSPASTSIGSSIAATRDTILRLTHTSQRH